ncbi:MAG: hypothetical protein IJR02_06625 [Bacteroidaceae bacterium]|nr:hypothetical protein [Bacteroidaceae bacterium]MBQ6750428.1 hypothetical protein [Bacteroidaceae bacterium]
MSIPGSVTSIGANAFANCQELRDVYCYGEIPPSVYSNAFEKSYIEYATLHVPEESLDAYKNTSPWSGFGTIVSVEDNKKNYQMVVSVSDLRGIVTYGKTSITNGRETFDVKEGSDVVLMLTPRDGCKVKSVKVNGIEKVAEVNGGGELTIANVEGNLSVEVEFECAGDNMMATIGSNGFATFCSMEALDFSEVEDVKAYIVSAFQPKKGEVTLTRVFEVPAGMGLVLIGKEGEYEIPLCTGEAMVSNQLVGINENTTLKATENDRTNFILPEDQEKAAFCAVTDEVELPFGKAYLPLPTESVAHLKDGKLTLHLADPSLGDVDGDGYVNISDVTTLVNIILGK